TLPSFKVLDYNNKEFEINSLVESPTVVSFWSHIYYDHFKKSQRKIKELKKKYPEVKFITINIDNIDAEKPKQTLKECRFKYNDQYLFKTPKETTEMLAVYPMTKTILLDENKKIVSPNSNMFTRNFEQQLLGLINQ
uniref:TlpA family protein disulfide reductase n=1 Tax=Seonamhaeicola sp. TaxID=1912245 RepID=UPI003564A1F4